MKKFLFLLMAVTVSISAMSQGNKHGKGNGKHKQDKHYSKKSDSRYDRDENYDRRWDNDQNRQNQQGGKIAKNIPTPVANAFYRDFPNAGNVTWTKDKGIWTAHLGNGGILNRNGTVSYRSNGQRVDGTYSQRNNYPANSGNSNGGILDKVLGRN